MTPPIDKSGNPVSSLPCERCATVTAERDTARAALVEADKHYDGCEDALDILFERTDTEMRRLSALCGGFVTAVLTITARVDPNTTRELNAWRQVESLAQSVKHDLPPIMPLPEAPRTRIPELRAALKDAEARIAQMSRASDERDKTIAVLEQAREERDVLRAAAKALVRRCENRRDCPVCSVNTDRVICECEVAGLSAALAEKGGEHG